MKYLVYVIHGSKYPYRTQKMLQFIEEIQSNFNLSYKIVMLDQPTFSMDKAFKKIFDSCQSNVQIIFCPILLFKALHIKRDIQKKAQQLQEKYNFTYCIASTFGEQPEIIHYFANQINNIIKNHTINKLILVAHGSSKFTTHLHAIQTIKTSLQNQFNQPLTVSFLHGEPNYQLVLKEINENENIIIIPYFLGDGTLVNKIKKYVYEFRNKDNTIIINNLEFNKNIIPSINRCINQALEENVYV